MNKPLSFQPLECYIFNSGNKYEVLVLKSLLFLHFVGFK